MRDTYKRRSVLAGLLTGGVLATSGCMSNESDDSDLAGTDTDRPTDTQTTDTQTERPSTETSESTETEEQTEEEPTEESEPNPALEILGDRIFAQSNWFFEEMPDQRTALSQQGDQLLSRVDNLLENPADLTAEDVESLHTDVQSHAEELNSVGTSHYAASEATDSYALPFSEADAEYRNELVGTLEDNIEFQDTDAISENLSDYRNLIPIPEWSPEYFSGFSFGSETAPGTGLNVFHTNQTAGFDNDLVAYGMFRLVHLVMGNLEGRANDLVTEPDVYFPRRDERIVFGGNGQGIESLRSRANRYREPFDADAAENEVFWRADIQLARATNRYTEGHLYQFADEATAADSYSAFTEAAPTRESEAFPVGEAAQVGLVSESGNADTLYAYGIQKGTYVLIFNGHEQQWGERGFENDVGLHAYDGEL